LDALAATGAHMIGTGLFFRQLERMRLAGAVFAGDENAATAVEYALIAGIVSISIVAAALGIKGSLVDSFTSVVTGFEEAKN
jgi:pilus assembly protein Flp/PilA